MWVVGHKVEFVRLYARLSWGLPDIYDFHPKSFILPLQMDLLQNYMASFPRRADRTVIIKPDRGSQGRGIQLVQDYEDVEDYSDSAVAQVYLAPFLLGGKKFDLRIYVLVTSCDPLRAYLFREGIARFCTQDYQAPRADNLDVPYSHLTNFSLNKHSADFDYGQNKRYQSAVFAQLAAAGVDVDLLQWRIRRIVRLTLIAGQPTISSSYHTGIRTNDGRSRCFEILGFDILVGADARPWLLEVNCMPSLAAFSQFDNELKTRVLMGVLKIIDLHASFRGLAMLRFKETCAQKGQLTSVFDPEREAEIARSTEWDQLIPIVDDPDMERVCGTASTFISDKPKPNPAGVARPPKPLALPQKVTLVKPIAMIPRPVIEARPLRAGAFAKTPEVRSVFVIARSGEGRCQICETDERERLLALRTQAQLGMPVSMVQCLRMLFPDGKTTLFDRVEVTSVPWPKTNRLVSRKPVTL
jgi:tubulin polyglutamylase TTLL6/13